MEYKTLLTIHQVDRPSATIKPFIEFASAKGAHLNVVVLGTVTPPPASLYSSIPVDYWKDNYDKVISNVEKRVEEIEKLVQQAGISASVLPECQEAGFVEGTIGKYALYTDMTVLESEGLITDPVATNTYNGAVFETGRPVLVLPSSDMKLHENPRVLIGWDGGAQASRAVHNALPLLRTSEEVHIAVVDPDLSSSDPHPGHDIAAYLARWGLKVTVDRLVSGGLPVEDVLAQRAMDVAADVIVMGAYGHARFRQWLLGGTTRNILQKPPLPIFMSH